MSSEDIGFLLAVLVAVAFLALVGVIVHRMHK
jgi:type II secretory pathway component PulJ